MEFFIILLFNLSQRIKTQGDIHGFDFYFYKN